MTVGKRLNLAELAQEPVLEARVPDLQIPALSPTTVALHRVAANPLNPRETLGDLTELTASLRSVGQLQPCTAVSRAAYLEQYPEHEATIGSAAFVAVTGGRRRAAAELAGLESLDIVVKDAIASSRESLAAVAVTENIERRNFDVLEEARAVRMLVDLCGDGVKAAERLSRTKGWVSQRLALLELSAEMQGLLRAGELPVREARRLARLDRREQLATWRAELAAAEQARFTAVNQSTAGDRETSEQVDKSASDTPARSKRVSRASSQESMSTAAGVRGLGDTPADIARALRTYLSVSDLALLIEFLSSDAA